LLKLKANIFFHFLILPLWVVFALSCKSTKQAVSSAEPTTKTKGISEQDELKFAYYFVEGCKERMKANIEVAEGLFKECLKIDPSSAPVKYELGNIYRFNGLYDEALKYGKDCSGADPKNEWYQLLYIECLHNKRQYAQAADVYAKLIKYYPNRSDFYEGLAAEYMYSGNYEKSYKTYDDLEKKFGQSESFTLNKIKLLKQLKKNTEVEVEFKKLIQSNVNEARYYTYLAEFYQETNQNEKALGTYNAILKIDPKNPMIHLALADYYKSKSDVENFYKEIKIAFENPDLEIDTKIKILTSYYELSEVNATYKQQAEELCAIMLKLNPNSAEAHSIYADFLYKDKKLSEAHTEYETSVKLDKSQYAVWNQLMIIESEIGEYKSLEAHSTETMDLFPNQSLPYFFNGISNITLKNYKKAVESLNDGLEFVYENNPLLIQFYSSLGDAYNYLKEYEKSDKAFDDALKVDPDHSEILNNYAYYLSLRKDKLEKAEKLSKRSNELAPNNRAYIDTYGWILYQLGKYKEAEIWLSRSAKIGNKSAVLLEHYGDVLYKLNKIDEAVIIWKEAKAAGQGSEFLDKKIADKKLND
jgi:tetratricopeptide (TPR) repeat protein